jgi:hypothetical protein
MEKPKVVIKRCVGLNVLSGGVAPPSAYALYSEIYSNGVERLSSGHVIHSVLSSSMLNGTDKEKQIQQETYHPELFSMIQAAAILNKAILDVCLDLDSKRGSGEKVCP